MAVSDNFTKLKERVDDADRRIREATTQDKAQVRLMVDAARKNADDRAAELRATSQDAADNAERQWNQVQADWNHHVQRIRERVDAKKTALDIDLAERDADWAEADALDAIDFASAAVEEAEYAVLDAVLARKDARVLAGASGD